MSILDRQTRMPVAYDAGLAADAPDVGAAARPLLQGVAGCSPYLLGLMKKEADWLEAVLAAPENAIAGVIDWIAGLPEVDLGVGLRQAKRRVALGVALADLAGVWALKDVTGALTRLGDAAVNAAFAGLVGKARARGKLPASDAAMGGIFALAMGKMGADELNYSSDIDLIVLFDDEAYDRADRAEARAALVRVTRDMVGLLSEVTEQGYVFRTDLRLRPDASVTPVCLSASAAEGYYESVGRTWERAAYIKARAAAGDIAAGEAFLERLRPFVWRRHLDFAAIEDAHDIRLKIKAHKGFVDQADLDGHNIKLGRGGIREIEFFTQTRQLIAGGRDADLRKRGTLPALAALSGAGWVDDAACEGLSACYLRHREVEHRVQMIADQQTHDLPGTPEAWDRLACLMATDADGLRGQIATDLDAVHAWTDEFFAPDHAPAPVPEFGAETTARWPDYPALRSERAVAIFRRLSPVILGQLQASARPEEALASFDAFLAGLPAGVQLFSLFEANPDLTGLMVDICATAPALADYLSRNAGVLDAVIAGDFFAPWPGKVALQAALAEALAVPDDYEARLTAARRWAKEWHFRIGVHHLRGMLSAEDAGRQYADLAEAVLGALWPVVQAQFADRYGAPPGRGAVMLGMGSLGAGRLHAASDLDVIVIYDGAGVAASDGPKSLATGAYYARLTQAMITAVSAPMADGRIYEMDMRLRPSGRQGPVATALAAFESYQSTDAWTWEHLALTRARVITGPDDLAADVEAVRNAVLRDKSGGATIRADVAEMRARLAVAKPGAGGLEAKEGAGRLQEVELCAQTLALLAGSAARTTDAQVSAAVAAGLTRDADGRVLCDAAVLLWAMQAAMRLIAGAGAATADLGAGGAQFVLRETGESDMAALEDKIAQVAAQTAKIFGRILEDAP